MKKNSREFTDEKKFTGGNYIPYSISEEDYIKKWYGVKKKQLLVVVNGINKKFWKGKEVRTEKAIERKIARMRLNRSPNSDYTSRSLVPKNKEIWKLKKAGKSYTQIAKMTNTPLNTVKSIINYIKHHTMLEETEELKVKYKDDKDIKDYEVKEELKKRISDLEREVVKRSAINTVIVDTVKETIHSLEPIKIPAVMIRSQGMHKPETAMLELSDLHVGEKVLKEDVANVTEYNFDIFLERMDNLMQGIAECIDIQRSKIPIDTLDINVLGDMVSGTDIYLGQARNVDMFLIKQTFEGANAIVHKLLLPCSRLFNKVRVRAVWGNHGRGWGKPGQVHQKTNFDYITYVFMQETLKNQKNIQFYIAECPLMLYKVPEAPDWNHLLSHGSEVRSYMSLPYYGMERDHGKYVQLFGMNVNFLHLGHFHRACKIDVPYGERIVNGAFTGGSDLSVLRMKTASQPKQLFFGFNNARGITWRYDIQLAPMRKLVADKKGVFTPYNTDSAILSQGGKK